MSQTVTLNGVSYTVPDPDDTGWGTYTTSYLTAIASNMLQKNGGSFALTNDADFGSTKGLIAAYFKSASSNIAGAGAVRLSNTDDIGFRNAGNDGDLLLSADASTDGILTYNSVALATISATQTLTNKTLTSPVVNTGISGTAIDNNTSLGSSATKVPTQNAVKSYVDAQLTASDLDFTGDTGGAQAVDLDSETLTVEGSTGIDTVSSDADGSSPKISIAIDSTVATLTGTQTLTNKTINSPKVNEDVVLTATSTYLNRMDATSSVQTQLNAKQATITGAATTIASSDLTASKALQSNGSGKVEVSSVTTTELGYVSGVTSALQTQLNAKQATIDSSNRLDADLIHDGTVSNTEFGYINSLTSNVQTQLDAKAPISQPEFTSYVDFDSISAPGAPSDSGDVRLYANSSKLYFQGQGDGSPTEVGSGGGGAGDADTIQLKAANDFSAVNVAPWYTGNNPVPGGGGSIGGTWEISTSNPLINIDGKTNVFHYSNGTSNRKNDYFEIELDVPNYAKGHNLVLQLFYRTVGAEDTDFLFFARDRTADYETTTSSSGALNTITLASATGFAVGDRICIQDSSDARHFRYVTAVSGSDITFSGSAITVGSGDVVISKYFTDELDTIAAENNTTNYEGKIRKWAFQINETTTKIRVGFIYDNTATSTNELFFDQILLSSNQFLQTSAKLPTQGYTAYWQSNFWVGTAGDGSLDARFDKTKLHAAPGTPAIDDSDFITVSDTGSGASDKTLITAKQRIKIILNGFTNPAGGNAGYIILGANSSYGNTGDEQIATQGPSAGQYTNVTASIILEKNDYVYFKWADVGTLNGGASITLESMANDVVLLNSQDEIFTDWVDAGAMTVTQTSSTGDKPSSIEVDRVQWRRDGGDMILRWSFYASNKSGGTSGTGDYLFHLPSGYSMDSGKVNYYATNEGYGDFTTAGASSLGFAHVQDNSGGAHFTGQCFAYDDTKFRMAGLLTTHATVTRHTFIGSDNGYTWANMNVYSCNVRIPIAGWTSTFNPVLSMPLVEIGGNKESGLWYGASANNANGSSGYTYRPFYSNVSYNTVSNLGTVTNNDVSAWNFQANQKVKATINWTWSQTSSGSYSASIIKKNTLGSNVSDGNSDWTGYKLAKANTQAASTPVEISATVLMEAGDYLFPVTNATNSDTATDRSMISFTVEKDFSNQNMAHIIKPSVCILKNILAYNAGGGATTINDWNKCPLNTIEGESWFVTLNDSTDVFTLSPGMYELDAVQPLVRPNRCQVVIYDEDNSSFTVAGTSNYFDNSNVVCGEASLKGVFTITTSTQFSFRYRVTNAQSGTGLGEPVSETSPPLSVYAQIKIRKLK